MSLFKNCRNHKDMHHLCQKPAKSGFARIWKRDHIIKQSTFSSYYFAILGQKKTNIKGKLDKSLFLTETPPS